MQTLHPISPSFRSHPVPGASLATVLIAVATIAGLYFGREVLVPIALAVLLSFVLAPPVRILQRLRLPRGIAVGLVTLVAFAAIFGLGARLVSQVTQLAADLPSYQATLRGKIQSLRGATTQAGTIERASEVLQDLRREIEQPKDQSPAIHPGGIRPDKPIPVEVQQPDPGALQSLAALIRPLIVPLTTAGITVIFVVFILLQREDLRNRIVRLAGTHDLQRTTAALDEAGQRLSRLFTTQLALNAGFGLVIGVGLWLIGVPNAALWGTLAMIMRFVPYVGAFVSALFPLALAAAVGPDWSMALWTGALFLLVEPIVGHVIEPLVYGHSAGLSPVAVLAAATFWTWLWGPIGLVLATPLTICLVVLGRHVDRLKFLEVMLGAEPPLTPTELLYQRLLACDPVEPAEQARSYLKEKPLLAYYENILLSGIKLAQADLARGRLDEERMQHIRDGVAEIIDDLEAYEEKPRDPEPDGDQVDDDAEQSPLARLDRVEIVQVKQIPPPWRGERTVTCVPGGGLLDEAAALIVSDLLAREGLGTHTEEADILSMSRIFGWDAKEAKLVCLCYVDDISASQVRYAVRRIRRRAPGALILVALLGDSNPSAELQTTSNADFVVDSLGSTIERVLDIARSSSEVPVTADIAVATGR